MYLYINWNHLPVYIYNNVCMVTGIAARSLLLCWKRTLTHMLWFEPQVVPLVFCAFPQKSNQYLLKVSHSGRVTRRVQAVNAVFEKCENVSGWLRMRSFILISQAAWPPVETQGLSGAVKRTYCCIPALTTAPSLGFTSNDKRPINSSEFSVNLLILDKAFCLQFLLNQTADKC